VSLYNNSAISVTAVLSETGWFSAATAAPNSGGSYSEPPSATRIADAREGIGELGILAPNYGAVQRLAGRNAVPDGTGTAFPVAVAATLTALTTDSAGYVSTRLNDVDAEADLWFGAEDTASNTILVDRRLVLHNHSDGATPVIVDLVGYFALPTAPLSMQSIPGSQYAPSMLAISATGRYVALASEASHLVPADTNGVQDGFVWDRTTGTTTRVSVNTAGEQGDGPTYAMALSEDGRYVAFTSMATNLGPDGDGDFDVFVRDLLTACCTPTNS
jgi:hypothetical protein